VIAIVATVLYIRSAVPDRVCYNYLLTTSKELLVAIVSELYQLHTGVVGLTADSSTHATD